MTHDGDSWRRRESGRVNVHNAQLQRLIQAAEAGDPTAGNVADYIRADIQERGLLTRAARTGDLSARNELDHVRAHNTALINIHQQARAGDGWAGMVLDHILADNEERRRLIQAAEAGDLSARNELNHVHAHHMALVDIHREAAAGSPRALRELNIIVGAQRGTRARDTSRWVCGPDGRLSRVDPPGQQWVDGDASIDQVAEEQDAWERLQAGEQHGGGAQPEFEEGSSSGARRGGVAARDSYPRRSLSVEERRDWVREARSSRRRERDGRQLGDQGNGFG